MIPAAAESTPSAVVTASASSAGSRYSARAAPSHLAHWWCVREGRPSYAPVREDHLAHNVYSLRKHGSKWTSILFPSMDYAQIRHGGSGQLSSYLLGLTIGEIGLVQMRGIQEVDQLAMDSLSGIKDQVSVNKMRLPHEDMAGREFKWRELEDHGHMLYRSRYVRKRDR